MSFWDFAKKVVQGKPVFDVQNNPNDPNAVYKKNLSPEEPGKRSIEASRRYEANGEKKVPRIEMIYCKCQEKTHDAMQVWATLHNVSQVNLYLDKVVLCGYETVFDYPLAPGQKHDFMVFNSAKPTSPADCYSSVYYRDRGTGEHFVLQHMVQYRDDQDGTFSPTGFTPQMPTGTQHSIV